MIVGHNHHHLEKRIAAALLSGIPYPREAYFLQQMSRRILHKGNDAFLSDRQAERLLEIFVRCEKVSPTSKRPGSPPCLPNSEPKAKKPETIDIEECFVEPKLLPQHPTPIVPPISSQPTQAPEPAGTREADIGSILSRVLTRNENFRKRRELIERQRLKS